MKATFIGNKMQEKGYDATADGVIISGGKINTGKAFVNAIKQHLF